MVRFAGSKGLYYQGQMRIYLNCLYSRNSEDKKSARTCLLSSGKTQ